jgi:hypothetical protein
MKPRLAVALVAAFFGCGSPAVAKVHGLLFGVSEYPGLPPDKSLSGPKNDVRRMKQALVARGIDAQDIVVLADGVDESVALPTRTEILGHLKRLATDAAAGDWVIIYGSGHGSRQKSHSGRKADGLDQLFLPRDIAPDGSGQGTPFRNAIVSVEFGEHLDAIRTKGAHVWFILDSCFSGSATRAVGDGARDKMIDPGDVALAVATALTPDQATPLAEMPPLPAGAGQLVAFYASQPNETAREVALPSNVALEKRSWGSIFTLALTKVLQRERSLSYRQAMVETGRLLRADPAFQARQTPSYEGNGLDLSMIGANTTTAASAWRVDNGVLHAGHLEGIEDGSVIVLYDSADTASGKPLGYAAVAQVEPLQARLVALRAGCDPLKAQCARDDKNTILKNATYARLAKPGAGAALRISMPRPYPGARPPSDAQRAAAESALSAALDGPLKGRAVIDTAAPDLLSWIDGDAVRFMPNGVDPRASESGPAVALANAETATEELQLALARALLRARQMLALQRIVGATSASGNADVQTTAEVRRFAGQEGANTCTYKPGETGKLVSEGAPIELCDKLILTVENQGKRAVLPAVFFLDDGWNLIARRPSCSVGLTVADRLEPGHRLTFEVPYHLRAFKAGRAPATANGAFVVGVPFHEGETELPNLCGLQAFNDAKGTASRSITDDDDLDHLISGATRGGARLALESASLSLSFWPVKQPVKK